MNRIRLLAVAFSTTLLISSPLMAAKSFKRLQVFQPGDPILTCDQLQNEIAVLEENLKTMDGQIATSDSNAQTMAALGAMGAAYGALGSSMTANQANEQRAVRDTYQQRRDILMQQFFSKKCVAN